MTTKFKHKKLVLSPVGGVTCQYRDLKGYTPQDAIIDWAVGRLFKTSRMTEDGDDFVSCEDVNDIIRDGYTMLVFTCGGSSETLTLIEMQVEKGHRGYDDREVFGQTAHGKFSFDPAGLYCTQEVVDSMTFLRKHQKPTRQGATAVRSKPIRDSGF